MSSDFDRRLQEFRIPPTSGDERARAARAVLRHNADQPDEVVGDVLDMLELGRVAS